MPPRLSIVVPTKNGGDLFADVLEALLACDGIEDTELIVVDSGSRDGTPEIARRRARAAGWPLTLREIPAESFSHGGSRNLGASLARGPVLVFMVQDGVPVDRSFLRRIAAPLVEDRTAAAFARQVPRPSANPVEAFYLEDTYPPAREVRLPLPSGRVPIRSIFFSNVCSAIRREVWEQFPFDEALIMSEDQKWAREVLTAGYRVVYEPGAVVRHSHDYSLVRLFQRNFDSGFSLVGIAEDSAGDKLRYTAGHLVRGVRYLARERRVLWIPYLFLWQAVRALGFVAGSRAGWMPLRLRRALSAHKRYWELR